MGLVASLLLLLIGLVFPDEHLQGQLRQTLDQIDFTNVVMNGMLAFLLFAGSINVNLTRRCVSVPGPLRPWLSLERLFRLSW